MRSFLPASLSLNFSIRLLNFLPNVDTPLAMDGLCCLGGVWSPPLEELCLPCSDEFTMSLCTLKNMDVFVVEEFLCCSMLSKLDVVLSLTMECLTSSGLVLGVFEKSLMISSFYALLYKNRQIFSHIATNFKIRRLKLKH